MDFIELYKDYQRWYDILKVQFLNGYNCLMFDADGFPCLVRNEVSTGRMFINFHSFIDCLINEYGYVCFKYCN